MDLHKSSQKYKWLGISFRFSILNHQGNLNSNYLEILPYPTYR